MAGCVESDGSVIAKNIRKSDTALKWKAEVEVQVTQGARNRGLLDDIQQKALGTGQIRKKPRRSNQGGDVLDWVLENQILVSQFLWAINPYLTRKQSRALDAILVDFLFRKVVLINQPTAKLNQK